MCAHSWNVSDMCALTFVKDTSCSERRTYVKMCLECLKEDCPDRVHDTMCLDTGSYMMNFAGCAQCQACEPIKIVNVQRTEDEDTDEEFVTFQHVCHECEHVIANHEYTFRVVDEYQYTCMQYLVAVLSTQCHKSIGVLRSVRIERIEKECKVYQMYCALCGHGEDERSIMPCDPRGPKD